MHTPPYVFLSSGGWNSVDLVVALVIIAGAGTAIWLIVKKVKNRYWQTAAIIGLVIAIILLWIEMAVGICNSPVSGN